MWETEYGKRASKHVENVTGHYLVVKDSDIDHNLAGKGVFLSAKRQGIVLPGTLLGLFPGVINDSDSLRPPTPKRGVRPYLERPDGWWIDYETELPYPMPHLGTTYHDFIEHYSDQHAARGLDSNSKMVRVPAEMMNPYAVGHMINHPPPDIAANCKTVDLDIPYTFFPSHMTRYLPFINCKDLNWKRQ